METNTKPSMTPQQVTAFEKIQQRAKEVISSSYSELPNSSFYLDAENLRRFSIAHEFHVDNVIAKWKAWIDWRLSYKPEQISEDEDVIERQVETGKLRWYKHDKLKRPCLYYKMRFHRPKLATPEEAVRFFIFMLEKGIQEGEKLGTDKVVVVYDRRGYSKKNHDPATVDTMKKLMPILQDYYPERLETFYVLGANWFYRAMFEVVKVFLSEKTAKKVKVLAEQSDLLTYFDKENLSIEYGGVPESSKFGKGIGNQLMGFHGGDDAIKSESEDERELKKLADTIYKNYGKTRPKEEYEDDDDD